jgi:hypothetical protein
MAENKPIQLRLRPVVVAYIDELDRLGGFGTGRAGVARRFIENGIAEALASKILAPKNAADLEPETENDDDSD